MEESLTPIPLPERSANDVNTCTLTNTIRIAVQGPEPFRQRELIDATFEIALFGNQIIAIIAKSEIIHTIDLRLLIGWVELTHFIECTQRAGPILCCNKLSGFCICLFRSAKIRRRC